MTAITVSSVPCVIAVRLILEKSRPQSIFGTAVPENGKKVLTDVENMPQVWEAGRVQLMVQGVLLPELWRTV